MQDYAKELPPEARTGFTVINEAGTPALPASIVIAVDMPFTLEHC